MPGADGLDVAIQRKDFAGRVVLQDIGFAVARGEVVAMLAPSGTGKTTALGIVAGLDTDFWGSVRRPAGPLGMVFQEPRLLPWLDVGGNLRLVAPDLSEAEIAGFLEAAGLGGAALLMPRALSLGMARRVALARALAVRPALLAMDEPFASLDAALGARLCREMAARARAEGMVMLMATHDLRLALAHADRILVLGGAGPATLVADVRAAEVSAEALRERFSFL